MLISLEVISVPIVSGWFFDRSSRSRFFSWCGRSAGGAAGGRLALAPQHEQRNADDDDKREQHDGDNAECAERTDSF